MYRIICSCNWKKECKTKIKAIALACTHDKKRKEMCGELGAIIKRDNKNEP